MPLTAVDHYGRPDIYGAQLFHMAYHACPNGAGKDMHNSVHYDTARVAPNHAA